MVTLPQPDATALAQSQKLADLIHAEIALAGEAVTFARFMELALYAPGLGYYSAGSHKLGKSGDFTTAPEISPLFARCVARQCQQILAMLGGGNILEIGAGSGRMACDLLAELAELNCLPEQYYILEISADLRERQMQLLQTTQWFERIVWLDAWPAALINGVILANEVMDALPVNCFRFENGVVRERGVCSAHGAFQWQQMEPDAELASQIKLLQELVTLEDDYDSEINLFLPSWLSSLADVLNQGLILLIDYGYERRGFYHPERNRGTLMCYYQHHRHDDPFKLVGLQDITAHVDFTTVAETADACGLRVAGYTTQAFFLLACGLLGLADETLIGRELYSQNQSILTLTLPGQMGELVKVMGLTRGIEIPLLGFSLTDRRRDL